ncbi:MAG: SDR family oxidoreductase, partial [Actinobacteria bacterium]|nr:SDR family oxidoreductase [Actinomycetota bacterium]
RVVVADRDASGAETVAAEIRAARGSAGARAVDVTDPDACDALMQHAVDEHGGLHVLFANAGVALTGQDGFAPPVDAWDRTIAVNLNGVFYCCRAAIPRIAASGGGAIVNTGSSMSTLPLGGMDAYAASKAGVIGLTKSLAASCGRLGIRVNSIGPGYVDTPMNTLIWGNDDVKDGFALGHATGLQTPEEIADVVVFLASGAARSLTGAHLTCDRGWTAFKMPDLLARWAAS